MSKAGHAEFVTRPFHRVDDLPYHIYQKLHHERQTEFADNGAIQAKLANTSFTRRELFICDAEDAQRDIIRQARKLQDAGEIILASADGGGFV